ncbi:MAG TPA: hypothetical protein VFK02_37025 [Kofleriaceae bacterium]|nr:hypothetical protein [Kofleriaceae bacterium]
MFGAAPIAPLAMRGGLLALLGALGLGTGCGRLNFSAPPAVDDGGPMDAPPVPGVICLTDRTKIMSLPAKVDLAISGLSDGSYAAVWVDPSGATPAQGMLLEHNHRLRAQVALPAITDSRIGAITDVGQKLVISTGSGASQTTWTANHDLTAVTSEASFNGYVMAHGQYPSDTNKAPRVYVTATGSSVMAAYIADDGLINQASTVSRGTSKQVTDLTCADGPDHSHCVWAEAITSINGNSQCTASDVRLQPVPSIPGGPVLSSDCYDVRTSSGPDVADSMMVVWTTATHSVESRYVGGSGLDMAHTIAPSGSAPKIQFDGTLFWISWLDGQGVLQLASYNGMGTFAYYSRPGWLPLGPEAFELARQGNQTVLAVVTDYGLNILQMCN